MKRDGMTRSEGKNPAQPGEDEIPGRRGGSPKKGACAIAKNSGGRYIAPILPVPVISTSVPRAGRVNRLHGTPDVRRRRVFLSSPTIPLTTPGRRAMNSPMSLETKYLHLQQPVPMGHRIDGWRVCWLGGWDKQRLFFVVMLVRVKE